jgi:hypothetical protein
VAPQLSEQLDPPRRHRGLGAATLSPSQQQAVTGVVSSVPGISPSAAASAVQAVSADAPLVLGAISALQAGNTQVLIKDAIPLIAGGVALVNPVAGAIVGAVLTVGDLVATQLGLFSVKTESCLWKFPPTPAGKQGACFNMSRTYGPLTPAGTPNPKWVTFAQFAASYGKNEPWQDVYWSPQYPNPSWIDDTVMNDGTIPGTQDIYGTGTTCSYFCGPGWLIAPELHLLGDTGPLASWWNSSQSANVVGAIPITAVERAFWGFNFHGGGVGVNQPAPKTTNPGALWRWQTPGQRAFALVFNRSWQAACEYAINGYAMPSALALLQFVAQAWNTQYPSGTPFNIDGSLAPDGHPLSFADAVVLGVVDQWQLQQGDPTQSVPWISVNDPGAGLSAAVASVPPAALIVAGTVGAAALGATVWALVTKRSILSLFGA